MLVENFLTTSDWPLVETVTRRFMSRLRFDTSPSIAEGRPGGAVLVQSFPSFGQLGRCWLIAQPQSCRIPTTNAIHTKQQKNTVTFMLQRNDLIYETSPRSFLSYLLLG